MTTEQKQWIDEADYQTLLGRWRSAPAGDPIFVGSAGKYYTQVMAEKKALMTHGAAVAASKAIGW